ncbi:MAG: hypothetical protein KF819_38160 [Labilithrix sp.]|nr:hypothetical protein [Labilithrix sp.]
MSARRLLFGTLGLTLLVACSGSSGAPVGAAPEAPIVEGEGEDGPHALGSVVIGETRAAGAAPRAFVSVAFVADAAASATCTRDVAGCALTIPCASGATKPSAAFDAGSIAISGAATEITIHPPYASDGAEGASFVAGAEIRIQASGAENAGFEPFDETISVTQPIDASLAKLPRASVFGDGALPVAWRAGSERVTITVSGEGGTLECKAEDAAGRLEIPREVIKTALGVSTRVTLSIARERVKLEKGKKTKGAIEGAVQPVGWLSLSTRSTETASFECEGTECTGPSSCLDCRTSKCRTEFDACSADATCPMLRTCLDDCPSATCRSQCFVKWPEAAARQKNAALYKCQCVSACATECAAECK